MCGYQGASAVEIPSSELCSHPRQLEGKGKQGPCLPGLTAALFALALHSSHYPNLNYQI